jgi:tripartite-type tricarboxylate transporter receptor subunit TctC
MKYVLVWLAALLPVQVNAQSYPSRPVTVVVGFAPGGGTDTVARLVQPKLAEALGQPVVVDNKTGAGGNIAVDYVAKAAPDGYTVVLANVGSLTVAPHTTARLPYDPFKDLAPITMAVIFSNVICVHSSVPAKNLADLIRLSKSGPVTFGSSGINGAAHLAGELLKMMTGGDFVHVPFKGGAPALQGLLGNQTVAAILTPVSALPHSKAGTIRAIATTGSKRDPLMPDIPTVAEQGLKGYEAVNWYAFLAPAKTPPEVLQRLHRDLVKVLADAVLKEAFHKQGLDPAPGKPEELAAYMKSEYETWGKVVKAAGIKAE